MGGGSCLCLRVGVGALQWEEGPRRRAAPLPSWLGSREQRWPPGGPDRSAERSVAPGSAGVWAASAPASASAGVAVCRGPRGEDSAPPPTNPSPCDKRTPWAADPCLLVHPRRAPGPAVSGLKRSVRQGEGSQGVPGPAEEHPAAGAGEQAPGLGAGRGRREGGTWWGGRLLVLPRSLGRCRRHPRSMDTPVAPR